MPGSFAGLVAAGDMHLQPIGEFSRVEGSDGSTPRSRLITSTAAWIAGIAGSGSPTRTIYHGGDFTSTPGVITAAVAHLMKQVGEVWSPHHQVHNVGNHDMVGRDSTLHNLVLYGSLPNVRVANPRGVMEVRSDFRNGWYVVPFSFDLEEQVRMLDSIPDGAIVGVHTPIHGVGMTPSVLDTSGVPLSAFSRFRLTLASHYHLPQIVDSATGVLRRFLSPTSGFLGAEERGAVIVLGTPYAHTFGDVNPEYGVFEIYESGDSLIYRFLPNPHSPRYLSLDVHSREDLLGIPSADEGRPLFLSLSIHDPSLVGPARQAASEAHATLRSKEVAAPLPERAFSPGFDGGKPTPQVVLDYVSFASPLPPGDVSALLSSLPPTATPDAVGGPVRFDYVEVRDFLSWGRARYAFRDAGLVLVTGTNSDAAEADSNGSGKSSLFGALSWALFDDDCGRELPSKDSVVRSGATGCRVEVGFTTQEGAFRVVRTRGGGRGSVSLFSADDDVSRGLSQDTNALILRALGIPRPLFESLIFLGSRFQGRFTQMGDAARKNFLITAFGLGRFQDLRERLAERLDSLSAGEVRLGAEADSRRQAALRLERELGEGLSRALARRRENAVELAATLGERSVLQATLAARVLVSEAAEKNLSEYRAAVQEERRREDVRQLRVRDLTSSTSAARERLSQLRVRLGEKTEALTADPPSTSCARCGQELPGNRREEILEGWKQERESRQQAAAALSREIRLLAPELVRNSAELEELRSRPASDWVTRLGELTTEARAAASEVAEASSQVAAAEDRIRTLRAEDPYSRVETVRRLSIESWVEYALARDRAIRLGEELRLVQQVHLLVGPKHLLSYLLDDILAQINGFLEGIAATLFGGDTTIRLSSVRSQRSGKEENTITVQVDNLAGSYGNSSDGEQRKVDIAVHLAIFRLLDSFGRGSSNILIGDQVFDGGSLDQSSSRAVVRVLEEIARGKQVFVISHSSHLAPYIQETLRIHKSGGESRIGEAE